MSTLTWDFSEIFFLYMAIPVAHGSSWTRGQNGTATVNLHHSHRCPPFSLLPELPKGKKGATIRGIEVAETGLSWLLEDYFGGGMLCILLTQLPSGASRNSSFLCVV